MEIAPVHLGILSAYLSVIENLFLVGDAFTYIISHSQGWSYRVICIPSCLLGLLGGSDGKEYDCYAGDLGSIPGLERYPGEGNGNPLQYSCLENSMDEEPSRLQSMGSQRVRHDRETSTCLLGQPSIHHGPNHKKAIAHKDLGFTDEDPVVIPQ